MEQLFPSHEIVQQLSRSCYLSGGIVSNLEVYNGLRNIIQNIFVVESTIQRVFYEMHLGAIGL